MSCHSGRCSAVCRAWIPHRTCAPHRALPANRSGRPSWPHCANCRPMHVRCCCCTTCWVPDSRTSCPAVDPAACRQRLKLARSHLHAQRARPSQAAMNAATPRPASDGHDALNASFSTSYAGVLAFIAVASEGSFARAADRLASAARQPQRAEAGKPAGRAVVPAHHALGPRSPAKASCSWRAAGVTCIPQALEEMRDLREAAARAPAHQCQPRLRPAGDCPLLAAFRAEYPQVSVELLLDEGPRPGR